MIQSNPLTLHRNLRIFYGLNVIAFSKHWSTARYWAWKIWLRKTQLFFSRKETMDVIVTDVGRLAIKLASPVRVCGRQSFCPSKSFLHNSSNVVYRIDSKFYRLYCYDTKIRCDTGFLFQPFLMELWPLQTQTLSQKIMPHLLWN